jgi:hypothetical protein
LKTLNRQDRTFICPLEEECEREYPMSTDVKKDPWVWVVVQEPGGDEQFLGMEDDKRGESFIPVFLQKEEAQQGLNYLPLEKEMQYEVQAIRLNNLASDAAQKGFMVFVLNGSGEVLEKIKPN